MSLTTKGEPRADLAGSGDHQQQEQPEVPAPNLKRTPVQSSRKFTARAQPANRVVRKKLAEELSRLPQGHGDAAPLVQTPGSQKKTPQLPRKRSLTMTDLGQKNSQSPRSNVVQPERPVSATPKGGPVSTPDARVDVIPIGLRRRELLTRCLGRLALHMWQKNKQHVTELDEQVRALARQGTVLQELCAGECRAREGAVAAATRRRRALEVLQAELRAARAQQERGERAMADLKKEQATCRRLTDHTHTCHQRLRVAAEQLGALRSHRRELHDKILAQELILNQQEINVRHLYKIAEELGEKLTEQVNLVRKTKREKDEASESAENLRHQFQILEYQLEERKEKEKCLKRDLMNAKRILSASENSNLVLKLEKCDMKMQLEELVDKLSASQKQVEQMQLMLDAANNSWSRTLFLAAKGPLEILLHLGKFAIQLLSQNV